MARGGYGFAGSFGNEWTQVRLNKDTAWTLLNDFSKPSTLNWDLYLGPAQGSLSIRSTIRSTGAAGLITEPARWATWAPT